MEIVSNSQPIYHYYHDRVGSRFVHGWLPFVDRASAHSQ
jgi:hypothetical protein